MHGIVNHMHTSIRKIKLLLAWFLFWLTPMSLFLFVCPPGSVTGFPKRLQNRFVLLRVASLQLLWVPFAFNINEGRCGLSVISFHCLFFYHPNWLLRKIWTASKYKSQHCNADLQYDARKQKRKPSAVTAIYNRDRSAHPDHKLKRLENERTKHGPFAKTRFWPPVHAHTHSRI